MSARSKAPTSLLLRTSPRLLRTVFNLFPAYRRTGARITHVADDFGEIQLKLPLNLRTRNVYGTTFGGSMYGAVDPIYSIMLLRLLGPGYVAWDKAATIRFRRPGRGTLYARFVVDRGELDAIRAALASEDSVDRVYTVELVDREGVAHATFEKTIHIRRTSTAPPARTPSGSGG